MTATSWASRNRERHNALTKANHERLRSDMLTAYGHACACCGETEAMFLALDHIENDGAEHRRQFSNNAAMLRHLRREGFPTDRYQLLCHNCNCAKGYYGACPHEKELVP